MSRPSTPLASDASVFASRVTERAGCLDTATNLSAVTSIRLRANVDATLAALSAAFAFMPFVPRLVRAAFTGPADRAAMAERMRYGLAQVPVDAPPREVRNSARPLRVLFVAGEPSGDLHASNLAAAIALIAPDAELRGIGGPKMAAAGVVVEQDLVSDPVMGVWPVVRRTPAFFRLYRDLLIRFEENPPDVVVGIDYPGLNLRLARAAKKRGVPFVLYVAPQVWAWAPWRTKALARDVSRVLAILPFEQRIFADAGASVAYVGHPLFEHLRGCKIDSAYRASLRAIVPFGGALVALMPGSRRSEVSANLPLILAAARHAFAARPGVRFVLPLAAERLRAVVEAALLAAPDILVTVAPPAKSDDAMAAADAAVTVSGTATLHLTAHGVPAVVVYRASAAGRALSRFLLVSPWIALPNLLSGDEVLPEFLASRRDGPRVGEALLRLLPGGPDRVHAIAMLLSIRERVGGDGVADRAARWVLATAAAPR